MKSKECKQHNHKLTHFLKVFIYMLVMLAPFFAIGVKCVYVINNKNANESYTGSYKYSTTKDIQNAFNLTTPTSIRSGLAYFDAPGLEGTILQYNFVYNINEYGLVGFDIDVATFNTENNLTLPANIKSIMILQNNAQTQLKYSSLTLDQYTDTMGNTGSTLANYTPTKLTIVPTTNKINISETAANRVTNLLQYYKIDIFFNDTTLSSVFYSAIDELDDASIFSWTTDTGIYTAINNMCEALGIVSPPLAVLLTYWSLITAIYIVIDIVIETFTFLTHWFTDKMV